MTDSKYRATLDSLSEETGATTVFNECLLDFIREGWNRRTWPSNQIQSAEVDAIYAVLDPLGLDWSALRGVRNLVAGLELEVLVTGADNQGLVFTFWRTGKQIGDNFWKPRDLARYTLRVRSQCGRAQNAPESALRKGNGHPRKALTLQIEPYGQPKWVLEAESWVEVRRAVCAVERIEIVPSGPKQATKQQAVWV
jgi:hypothetical protein